VAVIGLGGVGLAAVMGAVLAGAARIVAVDASAPKRELALALGATETVSAADPDPVQAIRALTGGGVDHAIEAAGRVEALETAFQATRRGGTTVTVGLPHASQRLAVSVAQLTAEARTLKGSYVGSCVPSRDIPAFLALWRRGRLPVDRLVSRTIALDHINDALDALADGAVVRQVITFDHD
jgi:alcohol dehydrogenase